MVRKTLICPACRRALESRPGGAVRCSGRYPLLVAAPYRMPFRQAVLRYKNGGQTHLAPVLSHLMLETVLAFAGGHPSGPQMVSWIPGDRSRTALRGYHPPEKLARHLARSLQLPAGALLVRQPSQPQTGRSTAERRTSLSGTFRLRRGAAVNGRRVLLVDDVVTTGSTFEEAVRVLTRNGADSVWCVAFAGGEKLFD